MTINHYLANFWQFNSVPFDGIVFKLGKQKRLISTIFFVAREAETARFKSEPSIMQSFNYILSYLRMDILIKWIFFFPLGTNLIYVVLLTG